jgi:hypothetical protein
MGKLSQRTEPGGTLEIYQNKPQPFWGISQSRTEDERTQKLRFSCAGGASQKPMWAVRCEPNIAKSFGGGP